MTLTTPGIVTLLEQNISQLRVLFFFYIYVAVQSYFLVFAVKYQTTVKRYENWKQISELWYSTPWIYLPHRFITTQHEGYSRTVRSVLAHVMQFENLLHPRLAMSIRRKIFFQLGGGKFFRTKSFVTFPFNIFIAPQTSHSHFWGECGAFKN